MLLRIIQFITLLLAAYFFGAYVHQNWISPLSSEISGTAFSEVIKSGIFNNVSRTQVLIGIFEIMIVLLLILQAKEWKSVSYILTFFSFLAIVIFSLVNIQTILSISNEVYSLNNVKDPNVWSAVKSRWLNYQYINGLVMVIVCVNLFISIFTSLANEWKVRSESLEYQYNYNTAEYSEQVVQEKPEEEYPASMPEPTIG